MAPVDVCEEEEGLPDHYICPICWRPMQDPVLLVDSGQVYDRECITAWLAEGKNKCPISGIQLRSHLLSPVHPLRQAIQNATGGDRSLPPKAPTCSSADSIPAVVDYSLKTGVVAAEDDDDCGLIGDAKQVVSNKGVSVYDINGLVELVRSGSACEACAAMRLMAEMDQWKFPCRGSPLRRLDRKRLLFLASVTDRRRSAELMLLASGRWRLSSEQVLGMLRLGCPELAAEVAKKEACRVLGSRKRMRALAQELKSVGVKEVVDCMATLANRDSEDKGSEAATVFLVSLALHEDTRPQLVDADVAHILVRHMSTTENKVLQFCIAKALEYISMDPRGLVQIQDAGGVACLLALLPPRNSKVSYSTKVFNDVCSMVTVTQTVIKALYYMSKDSVLLKEISQRDVIALLQEVGWSYLITESVRTRYLEPLVNKTLNSI